MSDLKEQLKPVFKRALIAHDKFVEEVQEQFGFSEDEAEKILNVFIKAKAVKRNVAMGRYDLTHGAYWDKEVMQRALQVQ
ncbi:hypothetical protein QB910_000135 [Dabrowskivirus KKP3916]|uniref:Uncharacterized protein n=1 Tax=Alicyclobacillus phage KKP_3916 TaxID=3040651 RepID=A0AAT9V7R5_9CAUD|nr:hypothetical protein QB910_000135 [Alicyclobacillus phage KKP 3916]